MTNDPEPEDNKVWREVPIDWEALEDAFENNAPEVHSYLHLGSGEVLRVVDGVADPEMHSRIVSDTQYFRVESVSSREQYRWMERFIQMVEEPALRLSLATAIDGKGAFRRFKDVLMTHGPERERWFTFRSERLRVFMEAWLAAHAIVPIARSAEPESEDLTADVASERPQSRRGRGADVLRRLLREVAEGLGPRELDQVLTFAEFVRVRRASRMERARLEDERDAVSEGDAETDRQNRGDSEQGSPIEHRSDGERGADGQHAPQTLDGVAESSNQPLKVTVVR